MHIIRPMNIVEINELSDMLCDFFNNSEHHICVGGICGSPLIQTILDAATAYTSFDKVLIVDGCVDYIHMQKQNKRVVNHVPYRNLFQDIYNVTIPYDPFNLQLKNSSKPILRRIDQHFMNMYEVMVISNAHLIDDEYMEGLIANFCGKVVIAVDPFDMYGECFINIPTIIRSFHKLPPMIAMARNAWGVETDVINKQAKGGVVNGKIRRASIGALQDRTYITGDNMLIEQVRAHQSMKQIKRNQKFVVTDDRIMMVLDDNNFRHHIGKDDILISGTQNPNNARNPFRLYHSGQWLHLDLKRDIPTTDQYELEGDSVHQLRAVPGNIIDLHVASKHRFNNVVFVQTDGFILDVRRMYMLMKNSINLTICKVK